MEFTGLSNLKVYPHNKFNSTGNQTVNCGMFSMLQIHQVLSCSVIVRPVLHVSDLSAYRRGKRWPQQKYMCQCVLLLAAVFVVMNFEVCVYVSI